MTADQRAVRRDWMTPFILEWPADLVPEEMYLFEKWMAITAKKLHRIAALNEIRNREPRKCGFCGGVHR